MKILAIDTTAWSSSVALWENGCELVFEEREGRDQAVTLPHLVQTVLRNQTVDLFLVNTGPGSFTGIRVGLAFAKGLSIGWDVPLKGMDNFTITYLSLDSPEDVLILIEAHRQDVFGRHFQKDIPGPPQSLTRKDVEVMLNAPCPPRLAGSGLHPFLDGLAFQEILSPWKGAQQLAYAFFKNSSLAGDPVPFYGREADVNLTEGLRCLRI